MFGKPDLEKQEFLNAQKAMQMGASSVKSSMIHNMNKTFMDMMLIQQPGSPVHQADLGSWRETNIPRKSAIKPMMSVKAPAFMPGVASSAEKTPVA